MRARRAAIGCGAQKRAAHRLATHICALKDYQQARHIAFYTPVGGEISLKPLIIQAWRQGKHCYLPLVEGEHMAFIRYSPASIMQANRFAIAVAVYGRRRLPQQLDLVLLPLVAFDHAGHSIGMGGGFYDRCFAYKKYAKYALAPKLVGVAHRCQQTQQIDPAPWDVPLDAMVSV